MYNPLLPNSSGGGIMEASLKLNKKHMPKEMPDIEQQEQLPQILIIYRDNDLFEKYVPEIARIIQIKGREVEIKNFPRGAEEDEIKKWYEENMERLAGTEIISDKTADIPYKLDKLKEEKGIKNIGNLDRDLIDRTIKATMWGEKADLVFNAPDWGLPVEQRRTLEDQRWNETYPVITKRILENQENMPNNVYIFSDRILDHVDLAVYTGIDSKDRDANKELFQRKMEELEKIFPEKLKRTLVESGIDAEKIVIKSEEPNQQELQEIDQAGNWVIIDRHSNMFRNVLRNAKCLNLPESSFYDSAREAGLIDIPEEEFSQNLEKVIDEKLGS